MQIYVPIMLTNDLQKNGKNNFFVKNEPVLGRTTLVT